MEPYHTTRSFVVASGESSPASDGLGAAVGHVLLASRLCQAFGASEIDLGSALMTGLQRSVSSCDRSTVGALLVDRTLTQVISSTVLWERRHHPPTP